MLTMELLASDSASALLEGTDLSIKEAWISTVSQWGSAKWRMDNPSHGQRKSSSAIRWEIGLHDGSLLTDCKHADLLGWLRKLVWSLFSAPAEGFSPLHPSTCGNVSNGLAKFVPWLVKSGIKWPHQITQETLNYYLDGLPESLATHQRGRDRSNEDLTGDAGGVPDITVALATSAVSMVFYLWRQRRVLESIGIRPMPERPWPEFKGAHSVATFVSSKALGWIRPLPDEVAVPLLNRAFWFLGTPADDIIRLTAALHATQVTDSRPSASEGGARQQANLRQSKTSKAFVFSTLANELQPWHPAPGSYPNAGGRSMPLSQCRHLILDLQAACCAVIQGITGLRGSDLCALKSGTDTATGLPIGVKMRLSSTGLNEDFVLTSETSKGRTSPRNVPWLLGSRRVGDKDLPAAIVAIQIIDRLMAPWRKLIGTDALLIRITCTVGLAKQATSVAAMTTAVICRLYKGLMDRWVDLTALPDESRRGVAGDDLARWRESRGAMITSHQLRKTYGSYVLSVHPDLLPALKRQFQHLHMSITESGYWGRDPSQVEPLHSVSKQMTAQMLFEAVQGKAKLGGRMGYQILANLDQLRSELLDGNEGVTWSKVYRWVDSNDLHVSHAPHGACVPLAATRMACWKRAESVPVGNLEPNYQTREASLCAGCRCFALDASHVPFWRDRYISHESSWRLALERGVSENASYRVVRGRADQALKILLDIGEDAEPLEEAVMKELDRYAERS